MQRGYSFTLSEVFQLPGVYDAISLAVAKEVAEKTGTEADDLVVTTIYAKGSISVMKKDGTDLHGYPTEKKE